MIEKKPVRGSEKISVTFRTTEHAAAGTIEVLGEFNAWSPSVHRMRRRKDGSWSVTVRLPKDHCYQFRYLVDGEVWDTDRDSEELRPNEYGGMNAVLRT